MFWTLAPPTATPTESKILIRGNLMSRTSSEKGSLGARVGGTRGTRVQGHVGHLGMV